MFNNPTYKHTLYMCATNVLTDNVPINTPDVLINAVWKCCILQVFEAVLISGGLSMMSVSLPFLDIVSYTGAS